MNINLNTPHNINKDYLIRKNKNFARQKQAENNQNINITRPAEAISFSGSAVSLTNKFIDNKAVNKLIDKVYDNEAAFNAIYALIIAGIIKPMFVLNMPGSEDKDKQIVATKNFLQAFLGCFMGLTIGGGFVKKAVDIVKNNLKIIQDITEDGKIKTIDANSNKALKLAKGVLEKENSGLKAKIKFASTAASNKQGSEKVKVFLSNLFKKYKYKATPDEISERAIKLVNDFTNNHKAIYEKNTEFVKMLKNAVNPKSKTTYSDAFESLWKNSAGAITAIGKAKIASILLPPVMAFLFAKRNKENERKAQLKQTSLNHNNTFKKQQEEYKKMLNKDNSQIAFGNNILNTGIDNFAKLIEKAGMSKTGASSAKLLAKAKKPSARMGDLESIMLTCYWLINTTNSKKIEPSQKLGLNIHTALVTLVSSTTAFFLDWSLDGLINKAKNAYKGKIEGVVENVLKDTSLPKGNPEKQLENYAPNVKLVLKEKCLELLPKIKLENDEIKIDRSILDKAIEDLKNTKIIRNSQVNIEESQIKNILKSLIGTEPIKYAIEKQCANMQGASIIAENLSQIGLSNTKEIAKEIESLTNTYGKKLSKFKSLTIFTLVVRFLVPVIMVPFSGKIKKKIIEITSKKNQNTQQEAKA